MTFFSNLPIEIKAQILSSFRIDDISILQEHLCKLSGKMCGKPHWKKCVESIFPRPVLSFHFVDDRYSQIFISKLLNIEIRSIQSLELDDDFWAERVFGDDRPDNWPSDFEITEARPQDMVAGNNSEVNLTPNLKRVVIENIGTEYGRGSFRMTMDSSISSNSSASISNGDRRIRDFIRDHVLAFPNVSIEDNLRLCAEGNFAITEQNPILLAWFEGFMKINHGNTVTRVPLNRHNAPVRVLRVINAQKFISMKYKTFMSRETAFSLLGSLMKDMLQTRHPSLIFQVDFSKDMKNAVINLVDVHCVEPDIGTMTSDSTDDTEGVPEYITFLKKHESVVSEAYQ